MDFDLNADWQIRSAGGNTGSAFMGIHATEKVFLKRNSSPFLAALSVEGITPRLIWTKRIANGDVLTAQEWLNGRTLTRDEMNSAQVAHLLRQVHTSRLLKKMLVKVGGQAYTPSRLLRHYEQGLPLALRQNDFLEKVAFFLNKNQPQFSKNAFEVCHGDLNHKNWLLSDQKRLYLVDWDSAMLADPAVDLSMVLFQYVPRADWTEWVASYGLELTTPLLTRIHWYGCLHLLNAIRAHYEECRFTEMNQAILLLEHFFKKD
ncbi:phosphotransferase enzyme family protein [Lactobacillus selangorensis]|uniref:Phosphotransferase enzyme family protein n=1 Tax=Lactobacillus selangorensis TaxID=81857 RepID=A0A0R2FZT1_9LACO|nr:phosphotransferase family protein [Lactobacillus selangorensis]KRN29751.1 phosphotransferase enzyme family protein [Lactobacillus selangorensis]KRN33720.1 phosphotransferase enzyme family protein [Lactobacillus selangorensis]